MAGRDFFGNGLAKFFEQRMARQVSRNAQRLSPHLAAGVAQFARRFHGVEHFIERQAGGEIFIRRGSPRADERDGIGGPGAALQIRAQKRFDPDSVADFARIARRTRGRTSARTLPRGKVRP